MRSKSENELIIFLNRYMSGGKTTISMHASESAVSPAVKAALGHDLSCRYSSDDPGNSLIHGDMIFGGSSSLKLLKDICSRELQEQLNCDYISFSPLSGMNAADIAFNAFASNRGPVFIVSGEHGGHPAFPKMAKNYGVDFHYIPFCPETMDIDWDELTEMFYKYKPSLFYLDASDFLFPFDITKFKKPRNINTICIFDVSHILGFVLSGRICNPLDHQFDAIIGSTHKSFPGPHKGIFGTRKLRVIEEFSSSCSLKVSSTHSHHILALTIALMEFKEQGQSYINNIVENGNIFASVLRKRGLQPYGRENIFTQTHQVWLPFESYEVGIEAYRRLEKVGVLTNFIKLHHNLNWGIRFGMQEITYRGFNKKDTEQLAHIVADTCLEDKSLTDLKESLLDLLELETTFWNPLDEVLTALKLGEKSE